MMKSVVNTLSAFVLVFSLASVAEAYTIDDYNASLVKYGVPFYTHYPASFYTGFAPPGGRTETHSLPCQPG